ncbi:hypothetical protein EFA69_03955 [Rufibacter immobilis]|uniref:Uncharacterized protein n=1 Tax=Rufibacter immobilis TaxID=1348778 RepID=A0A3M9N421_9BACT|nr:hypothetical protein [Rufibacter immobilis]RNI32486.1 hypothetical protein EFA69_03955 [Rufibacter immobilis]
MSEKIYSELQHLPGLPLTKTTRLGHVQFFHFGKAHITNASGLILDVGAWTLEVACHWQLEEAGTVAIRFEDAGIPRDTQALADPTFDPLVPGSNLRDRKLQELVRHQREHLQVQQVAATPDGDIIITFANQQVLHIRPSQGVLETTAYFWRFFSNTGTQEALSFGPNGVERA